MRATLAITNNDSVAVITLNSPPGNILDNIMMCDILNHLDQLKEMPNIKLMVFEGAGNHFSFGASVEEHTRKNAGKMLKTFHSIFYRIMDLGIPVLTRLWGQCLGGGLELALISNFIFAEEGTVLGQPEIKLGVIAPPASVMLPLKLGYARTEEMLITGKLIKAAEANDMGLINMVFKSKEELIQYSEQWIEENILPKSASSLRYAVHAVRASFNRQLLKILPQIEDMYLNKLMETNDANEGIQSFLEKRKPCWTNC